MPVFVPGGKGFATAVGAFQPKPPPTSAKPPPQRGSALAKMLAKQLSPPGYALDLPLATPVAPQYRGGAMLARGDFGQLAARTNPVTSNVMRAFRGNRAAPAGGWLTTSVPSAPKAKPNVNQQRLKTAPAGGIYGLAGAPPEVVNSAVRHSKGLPVAPPRPGFGGSAFALPKMLARAVYEPAVAGVRQLPHDVASGNLLGSGLDVLGIASVLPPLRGARALGEGARAYRAAEAGTRAAAAARAAGESYAAGQGVLAPALQAAGRQVRALRYNELTQQLPRSRSRLANLASRGADVASVKLQPHLFDVPGARIVTAGERVAKAAGREQRIEGSRAIAQVAPHLKALGKVKPGSDADVAHFWYAQLPAKLRNAEGLLRVRAKQGEELRAITSGQALANLSRAEAAVRAKMATAATGTERLGHLRDLEELRVLKTDLPQRAQDVAASIATLGRIAGKAPRADARLIEAARALSGERARILTEAGKLEPGRAAERAGLVSRWLGLEPSGEEVYVGHRLPKTESFRGSSMPTGGVGRVKTPQGVATENRLVLAKTGRVLPSLRTVARDWQAARQFAQSNVDRDRLAAMGTPFAGHVPEGHVLVNPRGRTIPAHWRRDELAQFADTTDAGLTREQAKEVLSGFIAETPAEFERMKDEALAQGVRWDELRTVSKRLVDRYYSQFRPLRGRGPAAKAYDTAVDAVATSIIFGRIGYIPKNFVQNLVMAVPHQGPALLVNAVRAGQVLADPQLRQLAQAEIGFTGATGALAREGFHTGRVAGAVSKVADDPIRVSAFLHEAAAEGVISRMRPLLNEQDRQNLLRLFTDPTNRPLLNDIRSRAVEAMADFSRMTPDQARIARRFLIIPGWLMAGTRYPFHFAVNHPARSALLAYIAMGEPGAPNRLQFNQPVDRYFTHGAPAWLEGVKVGGKVLRTGSISPVNTPWDIGQAAVQTARGKKPFSRTETTFDYAQPFASAGIRLAQGEGAKRSLLPLAPNLKLAMALAHPHATKSYPGDRTRLGRLAREVGVIPIPENGVGGGALKVDMSRVNAAQVSGASQKVDMSRVGGVVFVPDQGGAGGSTPGGGVFVPSGGKLDQSSHSTGVFIPDGGNARGSIPAGVIGGGKATGGSKPAGVVGGSQPSSFKLGGGPKSRRRP